MGAWLAVRGQFDWPPLVLAGAVLLWVAGFDLIYATMDYDFDRAAGLRSLVVRYGVPRVCGSRRGCTRGRCVGLLAFGSRRAGGDLLRRAGAGARGVLYEHRSVAGPAPLDVGAVNNAFFNANAFVGLVFVLAVLGDELLRR